MSSRFKSSLLPSDVNSTLPLSCICLFALFIDDKPIRICSYSTSFPICLESDGRLYPQIHVDGKVSSNGQAVYGISNKEVPTNNSVWVLKKVSSSLDDEILVNIYHPETDSYLMTQDVASPLTMINMEVSLIKNEPTPFCVWKVLKHPTSNSKLYMFSLVNNITGTTLIDFERNLPDWGTFQREISSSKSSFFSPGPNRSVWSLYSADYYLKTDNVKSVPFWYKFIEHQILFFKFNLLLDGNHPATSSPLSWPSHPPINKGVSFWDDITSGKHVYLIGNPIGWALCLFALITSITILIFNYKHFKDKIVFLPFTAWIFHYLPYLFTRTKLLYLHYYLPAFAFSALLFGSVLQYLFEGREYHKKTFAIILLSICALYYGYFRISSLSYGIDPLPFEILEALSESSSHPLSLLF